MTDNQDDDGFSADVKLFREISLILGVCSVSLVVTLFLFYAFDIAKQLKF